MVIPRELCARLEAICWGALVSALASAVRSSSAKVIYSSMRPDSSLALVRRSSRAWRRLAALRRNLLVVGGEGDGTSGVSCVGM